MPSSSPKRGRTASSLKGRIRGVAVHAWGHKWLIPIALAASPLLFSPKRNITIEPARTAYHEVIEYREKNMNLYSRQPHEINMQKPIWRGERVTKEIISNYFAPGNIVRVTFERGQQTYFLILPAAESTDIYLYNQSYTGIVPTLIQQMKKQENPVIEMETYGITRE